MEREADKRELRAPFPWGRVVRSVVLVLLAALCVFIMPFGSQMRNPGPPVERWAMAYLCGLAAIVVALVISREGRCSVAMRLGAAFVILALLDLVFPLLSYEQTYGELPWAILVATLLGLAVGGILRKQWWLALASSAAVGYLIFAAFTPPRLSLPVSRSQGGFAVAILGPTQDGSVGFPQIKLTTSGRTDVADFCDLRHVTIDEDSNGISVTTWPMLEWPFDDGPANEASLTATTFPPRWTRSVNMTVIVPRWPLHPVNSIRVPVPPLGESSSPNLNAAGRTFSLAISRIAWAPSSTTTSTKPCLHVFVHCAGSYSYSRFTGQEVRFVDPTGHTLSYWTVAGGVENGLAGDPIEAELDLVGRTIPYLTVEQFSEIQRRTNELRFQFLGMPNEPLAN